MQAVRLQHANAAAVSNAMIRKGSVLLLAMMLWHSAKVCNSRARNCSNCKLVALCLYACVCVMLYVLYRCIPLPSPYTFHSMFLVSSEMKQSPTAHSLLLPLLEVRILFCNVYEVLLLLLLLLQVLLLQGLLVLLWLLLLLYYQGCPYK
jgi:hypothetical protein